MTFVFTDVEGSGRLWASDAGAMSASLRVHDELLRNIFESRNGYVFTTAGDSFAVAFQDAADAVDAALNARAALATAVWPGPQLFVRIGVHRGAAEQRAGDYFGPEVNLTARLQSAGHGGQILVSESVMDAIGRTGRSLGRHLLRDVVDPVHIWQLDDDDHPPLRVVDPALTNLPGVTNPLVGRSAELRRVRAALGTRRLVTVTALGGTGKTRLAFAAGEEELPHRRDGVWFADLTLVSDSAQVAAAIASSLGLRLTAGDSIAQVLDYLADKRSLLIMDNCEQVADGCAEFADRFLARAGESVILATSRERLDVDGEYVLQLPPLPADAETSPAVELFTQRATAVDSSFELTPEVRPTVAQLCRRLDGLPLAIELAAARASVMSPAELLAGLDDRFELLRAGRRRQRHRALEATLDWSYELLDPAEQDLFRALGVFVGAFDHAAVAAIGGLTTARAIDLLESLIAKSLVVRNDLSGRSRFRLFETTTAYALQRLDDAEVITLRDRHLEHHHRLAVGYHGGMWADLGARAELGPARADLVAAFEWAGSRGWWVRAGELLLGAVSVFHADPGQGLSLIDRCLDHLGDEHHDLAMRLVCNAWFLNFLLADSAARKRAAVRLARSDDPLHRIHGHGLLALPVGGDGRVRDESLRLLATAGSMLEELPDGPDRTQAAAALEMLASAVRLWHDEPATARRQAAHAIALHEELGYSSQVSAGASRIAAIAAILDGDPEDALALADGHHEAADGVATGEEIRALALIALGDLDRARAASQREARYGVTGRLVSRATDSLLVLAALADAEGDTDHARELILRMGVCSGGAFLAFARHLAGRLGVREQLDANPPWLRSEREKLALAAADIETLRGEMVRRGWT